MKFKLIQSCLLLACSTLLYADNCSIPKQRFDWENKYCGDVGPNCILQWKGYGWWTNFHANPKGYFFESNQAYDPRNVSVDPEGRLKLEIKQSDLGGGMGWSAAEAVLVSRGQEPVNIGYGQYLVTVEVPRAVENVQNIDPATVFGAFTYYRKQEGGKDIGASGTENNLAELDMIELSKWGWTESNSKNKEEKCPFTGAMREYGCSGLAQLGAQPWTVANNLVRFSIPEPTSMLTFYMEWKKDKVVYKVFNGDIDVNEAASKDGDIYNWPLSNKTFIPSPDEGCIRFHLNFYRPVYSPDGPSISKIPSEGKNYIYVRDFDYVPAPY